ncbi:DUF2075 domain-containing protein [Anaeromyxobacter sp. SG66]|uniref:DUF2075 domain-containing protein n=1 Tax=Anaeromyxobacter sp. SG66 TaxID=2925410 RepID=UPI001F5AFFF6|nr:DUF2075 domain-containing protein [Anaeromyxobacter sp. SG66]
MPNSSDQRATSRAWYDAPVEEFISASGDTVIGRLTVNAGGDVVQTQVAAWREQIDVLRRALRGITGTVAFEFTIPRMGRRIDVVLLAGPVVFAIEFKVGSAQFDAAAVEQVWDYALDLKNFHEASHRADIVPVLVATEACSGPPLSLSRDPDGVYRPLCSTTAKLRQVIDAVLASKAGLETSALDFRTWLSAPYRPTPTIVEAARALYAQHSVDEIARHDAGAENLRVTSRHIEALVDEARRTRRKVICFVTGVPGAGKTLVGLNVATRRNDGDGTAPAVYLSGNGPLVAVLREALTRDEVARRRELGEKARKKHVGESVKAFIQNVHHFRDDAIAEATRPPAEHVAIFDEAQRAWTAEMTARFMRQKKGIDHFSQSEPEFLVSYMDRHDWAVVVCLVGGGQEINTGEAGIDAWLDAVQARFPGWDMHISSRLTDSEYAAGHALERARSRPRTSFDDCLHLAVSMRAFRAENVSSFVKALLDSDVPAARSAFSKFSERYPILRTRDLKAAKDWTRNRARGSERYGLLTSSKAQRLKPHAIDVRAAVDPIHWFLSGRDDTRSSFYLEDAATEFQVQGLELDWTCVAWDADLRVSGSGWSHHDFRGNRWTHVRSLENQRYLVNAYRVLLTRARQGMVIFVPPGNARDHTRPPEHYDAIDRYLETIGVPQL